MGSRGDPFDDAVGEAFFKTLKAELIDRRSWPSKQETRVAVFEFLECFYNRHRRHSALAYLSPDEYERINQSEQQAA